MNVYNSSEVSRKRSMEKYKMEKVKLLIDYKVEVTTTTLKTTKHSLVLALCFLV